ncbi:beta strand repeat-containing protein, partial [Halochromatium roseum]|uniref:beta strand repeat-containing protein n=1 Tax=Halochromatium roseum TaxID=391920 RepID=UPI0019129E4B
MPGFKQKLLHVAILTALAAASAPARSQTTWNGGSGNWDEAANWSAGTPNDTTDVVVDDTVGIDSTVTVDTAANAQNLTIDTGDQVDVTDGASLAIHGDTTGAIVENNGTLSLSSAGNTTTLELTNPSTAFTGTGVLSLSDSPNNLITASSPSSTLVNDALHSIQGAGRISGLSLFNLGLIDANHGSPLILDLLEEAPSFNLGTLQASNGGTLEFNAAPLENAGLIQAVAGSTVDLSSNTVVNNGTTGLIQATEGSTITLGNNVWVTGGRLSTADSSVIEVYSSGHNSSARLTNVVNEGRIEVQWGDGLTLEGTITNTGTIGLSPTAGSGSLHIDDGATTTLTGTGALVIDGGTLDLETRSGSTDPANAITLINDTDHNIRGAQDGGTAATLAMDPNVTLVNRGLIQADSGDEIWLSGGQLDNTATAGGTVQATGGGTLGLSGITVDNTGNLIQALDGSAVELGNNASIADGRLSTTGTGVISVTSSTHNSSARLTDITNEGDIEVQWGDGLTLEGTITNTGTIGLDSSANWGSLHIDDGATATLTGTGALVIDGTTYLETRSSSTDPANAITLIN